MSQPRLVGGRYQLLTPVGRGGMGVVWRAHDTAIGREVAVKQVHLPPHLSPADHARLRDRTLHEARSAAEVRHPAVVAIHDVVAEGDEGPWIVMELVHGRSLDQVVKSGGPVSPEWAASIGLFVLSALATAHTRGLLHRDVKPGNVLLADDGRIMLSDFGIATRAGGQPGGGPMGTPGFTAPEALTEEPGRPAGPASDLWSLGATIYTAVEGVPPFSRSTAMATHGAVMTEQPRPPQRSGALAPVLMRLLEKEPARRPDMAMLRAALRDIAEGTAAIAPATHSRLWIVPRLPVYASAATVIVAFVAAVILILTASFTSAVPTAAVAASTEPSHTATKPSGTPSPAGTATPTTSAVVRTPGEFTAIPRPCQLLTREQATQVVGKYTTVGVEPTVDCAWMRVSDDKALTLHLTLFLYERQGDGYETKLAEEHVQGASAMAESQASRTGSGTKHGEVSEISGAGDDAIAWEVWETMSTTKKDTVRAVFRTSNIVGEIRLARNVPEEPGLRDKAEQAVRYLAANLDARA
ncbi:protein kinase [Nonomuraea sp. B12E4]|uniref:serine/threonine-protein kinase n=1 Tax=Nonomuraea sp. B12E4 TaxID=3153564 RepID=UPI00325EE134